jgi:hypothetical protein
MKKKTGARIVPFGATCHYERDFEGRWWVVWGPDFAQDDPGRISLNKRDSLMLEMGFELGKHEAEVRAKKVQGDICGDWK